jgi:hypothetical protein
MRPQNFCTHVVDCLGLRAGQHGANLAYCLFCKVIEAAALVFDSHDRFLDGSMNPLAERTIAPAVDAASPAYVR